MYPILLAIYSWCAGIKDPVVYNDPTFLHFSPAYTAIVLYIVALFMTNRKDLTLFIKMASFGPYFIIVLIIFIIGVGIWGFMITKYNFTVGPTTFRKLDSHDPNNHLGRDVYWLSNNPAPISGILSAGYFLHTMSIPIVKNNAKQENNMRDVFVGYFMVFISYVIVGFLGYIGFSSDIFNPILFKSDGILLQVSRFSYFSRTA